MTASRDEVVKDLAEARRAYQNQSVEFAQVKERLTAATAESARDEARGVASSLREENAILRERLALAEQNAAAAAVQHADELAPKEAGERAGRLVALSSEQAIQSAQSPQKHAKAKPEAKN